jgi:hypothetical protein
MDLRDCKREDWRTTEIACHPGYRAAGLLAPFLPVALYLLIGEQGTHWLPAAGVEEGHPIGFHRRYHDQAPRLPDSASGQILLKPGDIVLVEGHLTLTHDAPVRVIQKAEQGKP